MLEGRGGRRGPETTMLFSLLDTKVQSRNGGGMQARGDQKKSSDQ